MLGESEAREVVDAIGGGCRRQISVNMTEVTEIPANNKALVAAGVVPALITILNEMRSYEGERFVVYSSDQPTAITVFANLIRYSDAETHKAVVESGILPELATYLTASVKWRHYLGMLMEVLRAFQSIAYTPDSCSQLVSSGCVSVLVSVLETDFGIEEHLDSLKNGASCILKAIAANSDTDCQKVFAAGAVPALVKCLKDNYLAYDATLALAALCKNHCSAIVAAGVMGLLASNRKTAAFFTLLRRIVYYGTDHDRQALMDHNMIPYLVGTLARSRYANPDSIENGDRALPIYYLRDASDIVAELACGSDGHCDAIVAAGVVPKLVQALGPDFLQNQPDKYRRLYRPTIQSHAARALEAITRRSYDYCCEVVDAGALPLLAEQLEIAVHAISHDPKTRSSLWSFQVLANIASNATESDCQAINDSGMVQLLVDALCNFKLRKHGCYRLFGSNNRSFPAGADILELITRSLEATTRRSVDCCQVVVATGAVPKLITLLDDSDGVESVQQQAAGILANIVQHNSEECVALRDSLLVRPEVRKALIANLLTEGASRERSAAVLADWLDANPDSEASLKEEMSAVFPDQQSAADLAKYLASVARAPDMPFPRFSDALFPFKHIAEALKENAGVEVAAAAL